MKRRAVAASPFLLCLLALPLAPGCGGRRTIEAGKWLLTIQASAEAADSRRYEPPPDREVEVTVSRGPERGTETVKVTCTDPPSEKEPKGRRYVLQGPLKADGTIVLTGTSRHWFVRLFGRVADSQEMGGNAFGRGHLDAKHFFQGTWSMVKAEPE
ncbi:MAG: hypothetical protein ACRD2T_12310 [Thermoanaerobaculia bacterium]